MAVSSAVPTHRPLTLDEFLAYAGWQLTPGANRAFMQVALNHFQRTVPLTVLRERVDDPGPWVLPRQDPDRLAVWMQSIDYTRPVASVWINADDRLKAFRVRTASRKDPPQGLWYTNLSQRQGAVALPRDQEQEIVYVAIAPFDCLSSTVADAYVDWARNRGIGPEYRRGGGRQFFIWEPRRRLRPA